MLQQGASSVAEGGNLLGEHGPIFNDLDMRTDGTGLAEVLIQRGVSMTKEKWLLVGALIVGLLVVLYLVFLCPSDCH